MNPTDPFETDLRAELRRQADDRPELEAIRDRLTRRRDVRVRRISAGLLAAAVVVVLLLGVTLVAPHLRSHLPATPAGPAHPVAPTSPTTTTPTTATGSRSSTASPTTGTPTSTAPVVTNLGHSLLGITAGWNLFVRSDTEVIRIEFASGRITATPISGLGSSGPVSFIAGKDWVMLRPDDVEPGYIVPDGKGAAPVSERLGMGGAALPGPDNSHIWLETAHGYRLVDVQGRPVGPFLTIPDDLASIAEPDGTGYLVVYGPGPTGASVANPHGVRRFTTGTLLAAGPTRWLVDECGDHNRCQAVVINRSTGSRHVLSTVSVHQPTVGAIAPDGTTVALLEPDRDGGATVHLINLTSGHDLRIPALRQTQADLNTRMVWSPDSQWVFVAVHGSLRAVRAAAGIDYDLGVPLPPVDQLATRQ